jgi:hypothetical protein
LAPPVSVFLRSLRRLLVTANVVPSSTILVTLMMEALSPSETLVVTSAARRNMPEDYISSNYSQLFAPRVLGVQLKLRAVCCLHSNRSCIRRSSRSFPVGLRSLQGLNRPAAESMAVGDIQPP